MNSDSSAGVCRNCEGTGRWHDIVFDTERQCPCKPEWRTIHTGGLPDQPGDDRLYQLADERLAEWQVTNAIGIGGESELRVAIVELMRVVRMETSYERAHLLDKLDLISINLRDALDELEGLYARVRKNDGSTVKP